MESATRWNCHPWNYDHPTPGAMIHDEPLAQCDPIKWYIWYVCSIHMGWILTTNSRVHRGESSPKGCSKWAHPVPEPSPDCIQKAQPSSKWGRKLSQVCGGPHLSALVSGSGFNLRWFRCGTKALSPHVTTANDPQKRMTRIGTPLKGGKRVQPYFQGVGECNFVHSHSFSWLWLFGGCYDAYPIGPMAAAQTSVLFGQATLDLSVQIRSLQANWEICSVAHHSCLMIVDMMIRCW